MCGKLVLVFADKLEFILERRFAYELIIGNYRYAQVIILAVSHGYILPDHMPQRIVPIPLVTQLYAHIADLTHRLFSAYHGKHIPIRLVITCLFAALVYFKR